MIVSTFIYICISNFFNQFKPFDIIVKTMYISYKY